MIPPATAAILGERTVEAVGEIEDQLRQALGTLELAYRVQGRMFERTLAAAERERDVIARELHDGPMQRLAVLGYTIDSSERKLANGQLDDVGELLQTLRSGITREMGTIRRLMSRLRPPIQDADEAEASLRAYSENGKALNGKPEKQTASRTPLALADNNSARSNGSSRNEMPRVLVVDDEPIVRRVLVALLAERGFDVVGEAANGPEAVDLAGQLAPDLIVMDIKMPAMDGKEATRLIRAHRPSSQIVLLSGEGDDAAVAECLAVGAFDLVAKSGSASALCDTLERAWHSAREDKTRPLSTSAH